MTKEQIIQIIYDILNDQLELATMDSFHIDARLNEDLYMDSILLLELILHLELDIGMKIPDEGIVPKDFYTVGSLADFLLHEQNKKTAEDAIHD
ncbi:petrobactin biosynthesis protein AsbD [Halalkalibacter okhensis]|uniref:Acyl carrier protein n=1 Tax=Halalkalibacter okhensis TaxID=333138 RepID=A0A0B0IFL5_9BACI|nr:petrobactin biosynthesis protein AsbD [Halalkalibacter okhensis]KHF40110.1 acyl carrier protein [Halalkalibacter okhensis]